MPFKKKRTGIFGGSFDPVHKGHVALARSFLGSGLIHKLLILLTPDPPHKQNEKKTAYEDRLAMLLVAFKGIDNVKISTLERELPSPSYTLQTIEHLQKSNPDTLFYLCIGEDSLVQFDTWHKYKEILKRVDLIVAERPGYSRQSVSDGILESVIMIDHKPVKASSTEVRQGLQQTSRCIDKKTDLPETVRKYIDEKGLYR